MIRRLPLSLVLALLLVACGAAAGTPAPTVAPTATAPPTAAPPPATAAPTAPPVAAAPAATATATPVARHGATLWVVAGSGPAAKVVALDAATEKELVAVPVGVPSQDWKVLYAAARAGAGTTVTAYDLATGQALRSTTFDGDYRLPAAYPGWLDSGLSYDGRTLVLQEMPSPDQAQAYSNSGKWVSRFAVLDTALTAPPRIVELQGNYHYDTMAPDGRVLYLIEAQSADNPALYGVRAYDLAAGALRPGFVVDKSNADAIMEGFALTQVSGPGGSWVFSSIATRRPGRSSTRSAPPTASPSASTSRPRARRTRRPRSPGRWPPGRTTPSSTRSTPRWGWSPRSTRPARASSAPPPSRPRPPRRAVARSPAWATGWPRRRRRRKPSRAWPPSPPTAGRSTWRGRTASWRSTPPRSSRAAGRGAAR